MVTVIMIVTIYAETYGHFEKGLITLKTVVRGVNVLEVQEKMKEKGYY